MAIFQILLNRVDVKPRTRHECKLCQRKYNMNDLKNEITISENDTNNISKQTKGGIPKT